MDYKEMDGAEWRDSMKKEHDLREGLYFVHGYYLSGMRDHDVRELYRDQMILLKDSMDIYNIDAYDINLREMQIENQTAIPEGEFVYYDGKGFQIAEGAPTSITYTELNNYLINMTEFHKPENKSYEEVTDIHSYHINAGHGNCSIIVFKENGLYNMWMVDCSIFDFTNKHNYKQNLRSCLQFITNQFKTDRISKLMITHLHYDHINGIKYLIEEGWIDSDTEVWMNVRYPWKQPSYNSIFIQLRAVGVRFIDPIVSNSTKNIHILYPQISFDEKNKAPRGKINNSSVLYQICFRKKSMLFTGDIETEGWDNVSTCKPYLCKSNYYCISHHGSITGHIRNKCTPANRIISTLSDCATSTEMQILMGRDGAYSGVYNKKVLGDFNKIEKTEDSQKYFELNWDSGNLSRF